MYHRSTNIVIDWCGCEAVYCLARVAAWLLHR